MAGTLVVSEGLCWMPAGWVFDNVLERMSAALIGNDDALSLKLLCSTTQENGGYLDLRSCGASQISKLIQAADDTYAKAEREGPDSFYDSTFYPGFMNQLQYLIEMLRARLQELNIPRQ
jgi:hypothetical protein